MGLSCRNASCEETQLLQPESQRLRQLVPVDIRHPAGLRSPLFLKERRELRFVSLKSSEEVFSDRAHAPPGETGGPWFEPLLLAGDFFFFLSLFGFARFLTAVQFRSTGVASRLASLALCVHQLPLQTDAQQVFFIIYIFSFVAIKRGQFNP